MTPRGSLGFCCVHIAQLITHYRLMTHCPSNDSSQITVYLTVMLQASWHTAEGN